MKKFCRFFSMFVFCLALGQVFCGSVLAEDSTVDSTAFRGESDCIYGNHRMGRVGGAIIYDMNGHVRYNNDWAAYRCSKCGDYFACEGDPVFYHTIGKYFVNPELFESAFSVYKFKTDASPSYKENTPLSGFEFYSRRKAKLLEE